MLSKKRCAIVRIVYLALAGVAILCAMIAVGITVHALWAYYWGSNMPVAVACLLVGSYSLYALAREIERYI